MDKNNITGLGIVLLFVTFVAIVGYNVLTYGIV